MTARLDATKTAAMLLVPLVLGLVGSGCSGSGDSLVGSWQASDGTVKTFADGDACTGMYWNDGQPLDIGGPMSCSLSPEEGEDGRRSLVVTQGPNQETLYVEFTDADSVTVYDGQQGATLVTMTRM